jgi:hypothetical protein
MTVDLTIDGRSRGTFHADHDADVDMTEILYMSDYLQYMYM